ncbi:MAG: alpha/beta hydrolase [Cyanobacteria bacterium Co-bin8]|nr:alpha/beta hydrolase [Cyanobacteria bacterium Co-bin8]
MKVLLIHGMARTSLSLMGLERRLFQAGFTSEHFGYFAFAESFDQIVERLQRRLQVLSAQGPYAVVVHSLGGLMIRAALGGRANDCPQHVVMLGTPNQPPRLALHAWQLLPFRWFTGQCGFNLTCPDFYQKLPPLLCPYTIIAGTVGPRGSWSPFGDEVNDGIVALSETQLGPCDRILQLPVWHTFMMNDPAVQDAVVQALTAAIPAAVTSAEVAEPGLRTLQ